MNLSQRDGAKIHTVTLPFQFSLDQDSSRGICVGQGGCAVTLTISYSIDASIPLFFKRSTAGQSNFARVLTTSNQPSLIIKIFTRSDSRRVRKVPNKFQQRWKTNGKIRQGEFTKKINIAWHLMGIFIQFCASSAATNNHERTGGRLFNCSLLEEREKFSNALERTLYYSAVAMPSERPFSNSWPRVAALRSLLYPFPSSAPPPPPLADSSPHRRLVLANEIHRFNSRMNFLREDSSGVIKAGNYRSGEGARDKKI